MGNRLGLKKGLEKRGEIPMPVLVFLIALLKRYLLQNVNRDLQRLYLNRYTGSWNTICLQFV